MKIIFLDIDGVLQAYNANERFKLDTKELRDKLSKEFNTDYTIYHSFDVAACYADWDKDAVNRIKRIIKETNAKIVVSSDWRSEELVNKMKDLFKIWDMDQYWEADTETMDEERMKEAYEYVSAR